MDGVHGQVFMKMNYKLRKIAIVQVKVDTGNEEPQQINILLRR